MEVTRSLARFVVRSDYEQIPEAARREAVRSLVNWVGCAVGGAHHAAVGHALAALEDYKALPQASVLGRGAKKYLRPSSSVIIQSLMPAKSSFLGIAMTKV